MAGALPRACENAAPVAHIDIFATAAAAAGAPLPSDRAIDGVDLVPLARGAKAGRPHDALFWRSGHYRTVLADDWKLQVSERPAEELAVRSRERSDRAARTWRRPSPRAWPS